MPGKLNYLYYSCACAESVCPSVCLFACLCVRVRFVRSLLVCLLRVCVVCVVAVPNEINEDRLCHDHSLQRDEWPWIGETSVAISI